MTDPSGIETFLQCLKCYNELPNDQSMNDYAETTTGVNLQGDLIVWCKRHSEPVCIIRNGGVDKFLFSIAGTCIGAH